MSDDRISRARRGIEAFSRGDLDAAVKGFSPEIVWEVGRDLAPDAEVYRGHDGVRRFWEQWHDTFEGFRLEVVDAEALDDERVLVVLRAHGVGSASGIRVDSAEFVQLFEFRGGEVVRIRLAATRAAATG